MAEPTTVQQHYDRAKSHLALAKASTLYSDRQAAVAEATIAVAHLAMATFLAEHGSRVIV